LTLIIHNAWRKGFKHSLDVFEPNIQGARKLLDFAFSCTHARRLRFLFISSFTVGQSWPHTSGAFPEESFEDPYWSVGHGYGESKYVTERV
jgi:nucleoside-diphosphate-sugar epimerase